MGVSKNRATPRSSILIRFSKKTIHFGYIPLFWGTLKNIVFFVRHPSSLGDSRHDSVMMNPQRLSVFGLLIMESARHMQDHWDVYQKVARGLLGATEREGWGWTLPTNNGSYGEIPRNSWYSSMI